MLFYIQLFYYFYPNYNETNVNYYLKRKIKLNFIEKYWTYLQYCELRDELEGKRERLEYKKGELKENKEYIETRIGGDNKQKKNTKNPNQNEKKNKREKKGCGEDQPQQWKDQLQWQQTFEKPPKM